MLSILAGGFTPDWHMSLATSIRENSSNSLDRFQSLLLEAVAEGRLAKTPIEGMYRRRVLAYMLSAAIRLENNPQDPSVVFLTLAQYLLPLGEMLSLSLLAFNHKFRFRFGYYFLVHCDCVSGRESSTAPPTK